MKWLEKKRQEAYDKGFEDAVNMTTLVDLSIEGRINKAEIRNATLEVSRAPMLFMKSYNRGFLEGIDFIHYNDGLVSFKNRKDTLRQEGISR